MTSPKLNPELQRIIESRHHDPFAVLGRHPQDKKLIVRAHLPYAQEVHIAEGNLPMERIPNTDLFEWQGKPDQVPERYRLIWRDSDHHEHISYDPYCFPPQVPDFDLYLFGEGKHWHSYRFLGAHRHEADGVAGVLFAVWAPSAERVSVVGNFNRWDGRSHPCGFAAAAACGNYSSPISAPAISTSLNSATATAAPSC